jgi:cytochrome c biogenesis protein CcmG, thiol:disulfide interchange protein DsbE
MGSRLSIVIGLVAGVVVAAVALTAVVLVAPDPGAAASPPIPTTSPEPSGPFASPSPSAPVASPSADLASASPSGEPSGETTFHIGQPAPSLAIPQVGGGTIDLATLRGKAVWVNFMQTTCPPCIDEFPLMNGFAARYAEQGLVIIAVDIREDEGTVAAFAQSLETIFPVGLDTDGAAQRTWGAYGLPVHFWVDREGIVRDGALGGIGPDIMAEGVAAILPGVVVTP